LVAVAAGAIVVATGPVSADDAGREPSLKDVKAATARFHSLAQAEAAGYTGAHEPCVASPDGAMGIHYVNPALLQDDAIDPLRPEILLYVPEADGTLALAGVEYWQAAGSAAAAPSVLGRTLDGPMPGHGGDMPEHYDLHVWLFKSNPAGMFAPFNASLSCPIG
jgi:hypothetical protein